MDELDGTYRQRLAQNLADETVTHRHSPGATAVPVRQYGSFNPGTGVGGVGRALERLLLPLSAGPVPAGTVLREKHGAGKLPADLAVQDWGVTYDELEPLYWRAEQMMGIGGKAGNLRGQSIEGGNVFEGPRSHEYPNPPHQAYLPDDAVSQGRPGSGLSSLPDARRHPQPDLPQSRRHHAFGLRVLRLLHALRLHDRRQGAAHEHAAAGAGEAQELHAADGLLGAARGAPDGKAEGVTYIDNDGNEVHAAGGRRDSGFVDAQQCAPADAVRHRRALRSGHAEGHAGPEPHAPGRSCNAGLSGPAPEQLHGRGRAGRHARRFRRRSRAGPGVGHPARRHDSHHQRR